MGSTFRNRAVGKALAAFLLVYMAFGPLPAQAIAEVLDEAVIAGEDASPVAVSDEESSLVVTDGNQNEIDQGVLVELDEVEPEESAMGDAVDPNVSEGPEADGFVAQPNEEALEEDNNEAVSRDESESDAPDLTAMSSAELVASGEWGECSWSIDSDGLLKIWPTDGTTGQLASSRGRRNDESKAYFPWYAYRGSILKAVVDDGVSLTGDCEGLFYGCESLQSLDLSMLDTSSMTGARYMFRGCSSLKSLDLSGWDLSSTTITLAMFEDCGALESLDLSGWTLSPRTGRTEMFMGLGSLGEIDVSDWDTSTVMDLSGMFKNLRSVKSLDLSGWDTSSVTDMSRMFEGCYALESLDVSGWDTSSVTDMAVMFDSCHSLSFLDLSGWDTSSLTTTVYMFGNCESLESLDLSTWNTSSLTDMHEMFDNCPSLVSLNLSGWDTSSVTDFSSTFSHCSSLRELDISGWDTSNATIIGWMFYGCSSLESLDLSGLDTSSATNASYMFYDCKSLQSLDLSGWDTSSVSEAVDMFYGCSSLSTIAVGSGFDTSKAFPSPVPECSWRSDNEGAYYRTRDIQTSRSGIADTYRYLSLENAELSLPGGTSYMFTGSRQSPSVKVRVGDFELVEGIDYRVYYSDNLDVGTASFTVGGIKGCAGSITGSFEIVPTDISLAEIAPIPDQVYSGYELRPAITATLNGKDLDLSFCDLSYENNVNIGTATVTLTGGGGYYGSVSLAFEIVPRDIATVVDLSEYMSGQYYYDLYYTGAPIKPLSGMPVRLHGKQLVEGEDYVVTYKNNVNPGRSATATVSGKGNFTGSVSNTFAINPTTIYPGDIAEVPDMTYTGSPIEPYPVIIPNGSTDGDQLVKGIAFDAYYTDNIEVGIANIEVRGRGLVSGYALQTFRIVPKDIADSTVKVGERPTWVNGTPVPTVRDGSRTLTEGIDYTLKYKAGKSGTMTVTITGKDNYTGRRIVSFSQSNSPHVTYRTHVQNVGWQSYVRDGAMSGTSGRSLRLEGINIKLEGAPYSGSIEYRTHVQNIGWQNYVRDGAMAGTSGRSLRLEGIQIRLTGEMAKHYDIYYRVHCQNLGWMGWAKNGAMSGSAGFSYRLEGIEIRLVEKGGEAPGSTSNAFATRTGSQSGVPDAESLVLYRTHVQNVGWQPFMRDGESAGTSGRSLRLEGIEIKLPKAPYSGGIRYATHVQNIGWQGWRADGKMSGTSGRSLRLEAIRIELTGEMAKHYDVWYRVHAQNIGWMGWAKNGADAGTAGFGYRLEAIQIRVVPKGGPVPSPSPITDAFRLKARYPY